MAAKQTGRRVFLMEFAALFAEVVVQR